MVTDLLGCLVQTDSNKGRIRAISVSPCGICMTLWIEVDGVLKNVIASGVKILAEKL